MSSVTEPAVHMQRDAWLPALLVLGLGVASLALRPALPVDETRYLEVFRESGTVLLTLEGRPYAEKPPLLFWLARALAELGVAPAVAMRFIPVLASAAAVLLAARVGSLLGTRLAGWLQAALLLPLMVGETLLFDPLLAAAVWGAVLAWMRGRDALLVLAGAAALLAKGPVALLFLGAFLWATAGVDPRPRAGRRAAVALGLALVPLAAWALVAARLGGPEFARALLWDRWGGRMAGASDHRRSLLFYLPVALVGGLPAVPVLAWPARAPRPRAVRRLVIAVIALLVLFTLFRGKQAHYLVPLAPAAAIAAAWHVEHAPGGLARLRAGVRALLGLAVAACVAALVVLPRLDASATFAAGGRRLVEGDAWHVPLVLTAALALGAGAWTLRRPDRARGLLVAALIGSGACLGTAHWLAGWLLHPRDLAVALAASATPVAHHGSSQHGLYSLLAGRDAEKLDAAAIGAWSRAHPGGLLVIERDEPPRLPPGLEVVTDDVVHHSPVRVLRAAAEPP